MSADVSIIYCILRPQECNIPLSGKPHGGGITKIRDLGQGGHSHPCRALQLGSASTHGLYPAASASVRPRIS